jgi:hypothetical protein
LFNMTRRAFVDEQSIVCDDIRSNSNRIKSIA